MRAIPGRRVELIPQNRALEMAFPEKEKQGVHAMERTFLVRKTWVF